LVVDAGEEGEVPEEYIADESEAVGEQGDEAVRDSTDEDALEEQ
jgi:hypothetical protein